MYQMLSSHAPMEMKIMSGPIPDSLLDEIAAGS